MKPLPCFHCSESQTIYIFFEKGSSLLLWTFIWSLCHVPVLKKKKKKKKCSGTLEHLHNKAVTHPDIFHIPIVIIWNPYAWRWVFSPSQPQVYFGSRLIIVCLLMWLSVAMNKVRSPIFCGSFALELRPVNQPALTQMHYFFFFFILFCSVIEPNGVYGMN